MPRNPWDALAHRSPGGSSSGAGVALLEGSALLALGSDTGGSVRVPAAKTGTVGLKVSVGRWSTDGIVPLSRILDTPGPFARTVADLAFGFAAIDPAYRDPAALLARIEDYALSEFRIGVCDDYAWQDCSPGIAEAVRGALDELASCGATLVEHDFPELADGYRLYIDGEFAAIELDAFLTAELAGWRETLAPIMRVRVDRVRPVSAAGWFERVGRMAALARRAQARFDGIDAVATPSVVATPPTAEEVVEADAHLRRSLLTARNTCPANVLGLCALTVPVGLDGAGMPVGLQLIARHGAEERLLALGLAVEGALGTARARLGVPPMVPG